MAFEIKCPNEHPLKIGAALAGQTVPCPRCGAAVEVPAASQEVSEQQILEFLGPAPASLAPAAAQGVAPEAGEKAEPYLLRLGSHTGEFKICPKCKREARARLDICPHCRTYFSDWREVMRRMTGA